jgi:hypothetical protein
MLSVVTESHHAGNSVYSHSYAVVFLMFRLSRFAVIYPHLKSFKNYIDMFYKEALRNNLKMFLVILQVKGRVDMLKI